ncbi:hypothetical protein BPUTEOMOX_1226 [methanotrophic endosymbiont of Bathymodiolus puteoserpentis (Logatchev)]|nr:hypothetical protein BPUTEOMOX_1226 [methanotrophic endosymbiont of Bathymodiolus puteoserpentis (Logatchev)]
MSFLINPQFFPVKVSEVKLAFIQSIFSYKIDDLVIANI